MTSEILSGSETHLTPSQNETPDEAKAAAQAPAPAAPAASTESAVTSFFLPPQGGGAPRRPISTGSPASEARLNVAMRILRDPVARTSFSRVYSGQARNWHR
jgi:hypothetical protein